MDNASGRFSKQETASNGPAARVHFTRLRAGDGSSQQLRLHACAGVQILLQAKKPRHRA
jgi:hypothetical protein